MSKRLRLLLWQDKFLALVSKAAMGERQPAHAWPARSVSLKMPLEISILGKTAETVYGKWTIRPTTLLPLTREGAPVVTADRPPARYLVFRAALLWIPTETNLSSTQRMTAFDE